MVPGSSIPRFLGRILWCFWRGSRWSYWQVVSTFRRVSRALWILLGLMGTITFTEFILEEALQQASFSCYHYKAAFKESQNETMLVALEDNLGRYDKVQRYSEWFNGWFGWVNPLTLGAFRQYNVSSRMQFDAYRIWLEDRKLALRPHEPPKSPNRAPRPSAGEAVTAKCPRCGGTGSYKQYGPCFRCEGTGMLK